MTAADLVFAENFYVGLKQIFLHECSNRSRFDGGRQDT